MRSFLVPLVMASTLFTPPAPQCTREVPAWAVALTEDLEGKRLKCTGAVVEIPAEQPDRDHCRLVVATADHCFKWITTAWVGAASVPTRTTNLVRFTEIEAKDLAYFEISASGKCSEFRTSPVESGAAASTFEYFHKDRATFCTTQYGPDIRATFNNSGGVLKSAAGGLVGVLSGDREGKLSFARSSQAPPVDELRACRGMDASACLDNVSAPGFKIGTTKVVRRLP